MPPVSGIHQCSEMTETPPWVLVEPATANPSMASFASHFRNSLSHADPGHYLAAVSSALELLNDPAGGHPPVSERDTLSAVSPVHMLSDLVEPSVIS